jgi:teichuronic acid biosynthesis glycosyltransferase TuaG
MMIYKESMVSILLPVCNAEKFLNETLESILRQTYTNLEIIAVDDDSKDNSYQILKEIAKKDKRLKVYKNVKRYGLAVCLNRLAKRARGQFVAFMNAQDVASLHRLKRQVNYLLQNQKEVVAVGTQTTLIDERGRRKERTSFPTDFKELYHSLVAGSALQFESFMINRRRLPKDILKFPLAKYPFIFKAMVIRLSQYGKIANIDQHLYYHRVLNTATNTQTKKVAEALTHTSFWLKSVTMYDYRPSVKAILEPFLTPVKSILN